MVVKLTARLVVDNQKDVKKLEKLIHHAEYLFDLESWPEIKEVYGVEVEKCITSWD